MWTDVVQAIAAAAVPVVLLVAGVVVTRRQNRTSELLRARLDAYRQIAPKLNALMAYVSFIGRWRDMSPPDVVELKRELDEEFFVAAPLFNPLVLHAYNRFMSMSFATFSDWGQDAKIITSAYQRRQAWRGEWNAEWNEMFALSATAEISRDTLRSYRQTYDGLLSAMVKDIDITRSRSKYTTDEAVLNAQAPQPQEVTGSEASS